MEELQLKGWKALSFLFYPKVLQKGLANGLNASEFPLLNTLGGFFFLDHHPWLGVFITSCLILSINIMTAYVFLPRYLKTWKAETPSYICLLLWLSCGSVATQANVIMPEGVAFPFMIIGLTYLQEILVQIPPLPLTLQKKNHSLISLKLNSFSEIFDFFNSLFSCHFRKFFLGALFCSLAISIKPTVIIALGGVVLLPFVHTGYTPRRLILLWVGVVISLIFPVWWYFIHAKDIIHLSEGPQIFIQAKLDPWTRLAEVGAKGLIQLIFREMTEGQLPRYFGSLFVFSAFVWGEGIFALFYILSLIAAISLDGNHIIVHTYYFIGTSAFAIVLMARLLNVFKKTRYLRQCALFFMCLSVIYQIRTNIWIWSRDSDYWRKDWWTMGSKTRQLVSKETHIITDESAYTLKLVFMGRSGTGAGQSVYTLCNEPAYQHISLALVSDFPPPPSPFLLCNNRVTEKHIIQDQDYKWYLTLVRPEL